MESAKKLLTSDDQIGFEEWWLGPDGGDQSMEDQHWEFWNKILNSLPENSLAGKSVFDFGCNQGSFLRMLYDKFHFKYGIGVDLARSSIAKAEARKGDRPLQYLVRNDFSEFANTIDFAISTAVIYLIADLDHHAKQIRQVLKNGGVYYASHPDYASYSNCEKVLGYIQTHASIPGQNHTLDSIAKAFHQNGFTTQIKRVTPSFVTYDPSGEWHPSIRDQVDCEYMHSYLFRFTCNK